MKVSRETLLHQLESIEPGLSAKQIADQSECFIFQDGKVFTYNDEVACTSASCLPIEGAVKAAPLLGLLRNMPEADLEVETTKSELRIKGKGRRAGVRMEHQIDMDLAALESPKSWKKLPKMFCEAVSFVQSCAGTDIQELQNTCIHVHPKWVEAFDGYRAARYKLKTGVEEPLLIRQNSLQHIIPLGVNRYSVTNAWMHFKNETGVVISCRKSDALDYWLDIDHLYAGKGRRITLPKMLKEAVENAVIFSKENADKKEGDIKIQLRPGKIRIRGDGAIGWFSETRKCDYKGEELEFMASPKMVHELVTQHNECEVTTEKIIVKGGQWRFAAALAMITPTEND